MANSMIFVLTGTSGSGRKSVARRTGEKLGWLPVRSCTTRPPRNPDKPDEDYHYISVEHFEEWEQSGKFIQTVQIDKYKYGVLHKELETVLASNHNVYLILNREGASSLKQLYGDRVVRIFIYVDKQSVRERLESNGTGYEVIDSYLEHYMEEVTYRKMCEYVFENVELGRTVDHICEAMKNYKS
ncbi:guanylate kinase [Cohnella sp.]|uniref:guanylate kinase n=1 Tax=Cohnella sp. TaxID=1883426 RepID=UPI00356354A4